MEGRYVPEEKLLWIPLVKNVNNAEHQLAAVVKSLLQILQEGPLPPADQISSAYKLKTWPELIR